MRRNSGLYERMCRGDMDAWADPGAILEMLSRPTDSGLSAGASRCAAFSADHGGWLPGSFENVSAVLSGSWEKIPRVEKMQLMTSISARDVGVAARVINSVMRCVDIGFIERKGFDPLTKDGLLLFSYLKDFPRSRWSKIGNLGSVCHSDFASSRLASSMESLAKISGAEVFVGGDRIYAPVHADPTVNAVLSMDAFIEQTTGGRAVCAKSFAMEFSEPVVWVPETMIKNGIRRRR